MRRHITILMGVLALVGLCTTHASAAVYNVMTYGAAGDGVADDWPEAQNAINAAVANGGGEVYFPAGTYALSATLTVTNGSVTIRGEGQRTSILLWKNLPFENNGIRFSSTSTTLNKTLTVRGLSLLRDSGIGGMAIYGSWAHPGTVTPQTGGGVTALIEDVHISTTGWPNGNVFWGYGIVLTNPVGAKIHTFNIQGANGVVPNAGGLGVYIVGVDAIGTPGGAVNIAIHDGTIIGFTHGAYMHLGPAVFNLQQLVIRDATNGVQIIGAGRGTSIANNLIKTKTYGIRIYDSLGDLAITNNRIYQEEDTASFVGIEINNESVATTRCRVVGNYIFSPVFYTTLDTGILVANNVSDTVISGNTTHYMTNGIVLANSPVTRTLVHGNLNRNAGTALSLSAATNTAQANNW